MALLLELLMFASKSFGDQSHECLSASALGLLLPMKPLAYTILHDRSSSHAGHLINPRAIVRFSEGQSPNSYGSRLYSPFSLICSARSVRKTSTLYRKQWI